MSFSVLRHLPCTALLLALAGCDTHCLTWNAPEC